MRVPGRSKGRAVTIFTFAPIPPDCRLGVDDLKTSARLMMSEEITSNENSRPSLSVANVRLFNVTVLNSGPRPRTVINWPSPPERSIATPVIRCNDSAVFESGNLPTSSAEIASTTWFESRLTSKDCFNELRIPVAITSSSKSCAIAGAANIIAAAPALQASKFFLLNTITAFPFRFYILVIRHF